MQRATLYNNKNLTTCVGCCRHNSNDLIGVLPQEWLMIRGSHGVSRNSLSPILSFMSASSTPLSCYIYLIWVFDVYNGVECD